MSSYMKFRIALVAPAIILTGCFTSDHSNEKSAPHTKTSPISFIETNNLKNYRHWTKVNPKPVPFNGKPWQCMQPAWFINPSEHI